MNIACVDLEGVLVPEMWPYIGRQTGISELLTTTREEPDYPRLMQRRLRLLRQHGIKLSDVQHIVKRLSVFDGAGEFLGMLRVSHHRVIIVSDAFMELVAHFLDMLGSPEVQCHRLRVDGNGFIDDCCYLPRRGKEETVKSLQAEGYRVSAVGDAFNDLAMLRAADSPWLFRPSHETQNSAPDLRIAHSYGEVLRDMAYDLAGQ